MTLPLREDLQGLQPYGAPQLDVPVLLNVNENPHQVPQPVVDAVLESVSQAVVTLNRYPDRDFEALRADLASYLRQEAGVEDLDVANIWAANGSNEVMLHLMQAYGGPGRSVLSFTPTYSMYPEYARDTFTGYLTAPRENDFTLDAERAIDAIREHSPAVVLIASPNNPTGTATPLPVIEQIARATTNTGPGGAASIVVVDEAYAEFRREQTPSALQIRGRYPHLAVSRTMSKAFAFAGTRLGYLAAAPELIDALRVVRLPYHLSAVTQAVARAALAHADVLQAQVAQLRQGRDECVAWLTENGFTAVPSDANFVLFGTFDDRHAVWQGLLDRGVLIRETGPTGYLRVSIGTNEEMAAFRGALLEVAGR